MFNLLPKSKHKRTTLQVAEKLRDDVHNFYLRDDISYQLPGKRNTVVVRGADGSRITYQKRVLLENIRETYELFKEESNNVDLSRSSFAELHPVFVIPKAALAHRNCLCVYHENVTLLLKCVDKFVDGNYYSSLQVFTDCMFGCWSLCKYFFLKKFRKMSQMATTKLLGHNG
ncbi:unnamed protein product [Rotaria sp. Silwood2]|nr:unnamed protein product [Rotaria sp. Silwood2]CAF3408298.1 unnamed protein product [Rotaria sp. Silwood2]CAF4411652.1 unnamed protein product [Rotaria sp. Silwood2]CAF4432089.1 unnamed protein product [Rotaria sp. Silwood2]